MSVTHAELLTLSPDAHLTLEQGRIVYANAAAQRLFALPQDTPMDLGLDVLAASPDALQELLAQLSQHPRGRMMAELSLLRARQQEFTAEVRALCLSGAEVLLVIRDITQRQRNLELLTEQIRILEQLSLGIPLNVVLSSLCFFAESYGLAERTMVVEWDDQQQVRSTSSPSLPAAVVQAVLPLPLPRMVDLEMLYAREHHEQGFQRLVLDEVTQAVLEEHQLTEIFAMPLQGAQQEILGLLLLFGGAGFHISPLNMGVAEAVAHMLVLAIQKAKTEAYLHFITDHDSLTGLYNRRQIKRQLLLSIERSSKKKGRTALFLFDLNRFKAVNDFLGHAAGDELLKQVATRLQKLLQQHACGRLGGDEFVVVSRDLYAVQDVERLAEKTIACLERPFTVFGSELYISASVGISLYPDHGDDPDELLKAADQVMYEAKRIGNGQYRLYSGKSTEEEDEIKLDADLRHALEVGEFELHYQPKVDAKTGHIASAEALIRWRRADGTLVPPIQFIAVAERSGLIVELGEWILHRACEDFGRLRQLGYEVSVFVNLSLRQMTDPELVNRFGDYLLRSGYRPEWLGLEVTETMAMTDLARTVDILKAFSEMGIRIAIDDFGIEYSSLMRLKELPIHELKIDKLFIDGLVSNADDRAITAAIIAMAQQLGLKLVAEGVEDREQLTLLQAQGCDLIQGYLASRPVDIQRFQALLESGKQLF